MFFGVMTIADLQVAQAQTGWFQIFSLTVAMIMLGFFIYETFKS